jgi:hypothetical protein
VEACSRTGDREASLTPSSLERAHVRLDRLLIGTALFVGGFALVFVSLNWIIGSAAFLIKAELGVVTRIAESSCLKWDWFPRNVPQVRARGRDD